MEDAGGGGVSTGNVPPHLGFAHLGFTVPDVLAAVQRLREGGVRILKDVGVCSRETVPLSEWEEERGIGCGEIHGNYAWLFEKFAMVSDPVSFYTFIDRAFEDLLLLHSTIAARFVLENRSRMEHPSRKNSLM
ncbi:hypothetical protein ACN38_g5418 [Penicillium nordicum]|uniref:Glyoxalase/fosfomycin resistance/dioxygenase domain-containing protein n=1 Tax=Penicillium nordicum TaxID=229535 RepID=A0A0M8P9S3_9EURO|nr:hypothetical protein ACN38_g5418 [Penicillium nordicum]